MHTDDSKQIPAAGGAYEKHLYQWNDAASRYTDDQDHSAFAENNRRVVRDRFRDLSGMKVLGLGCGYGKYTDYFRSIGADALGADRSECRRVLKASDVLYYAIVHSAFYDGCRLQDENGFKHAVFLC